MYDLLLHFKSLRSCVALFKLRQNGITGDLLHWISDYLSEGRQSVFIGSSLSEPKYVSAGVLRGSILGPLFFSNIRK